MQQKMELNNLKTAVKFLKKPVEIVHEGDKKIVIYKTFKFDPSEPAANALGKIEDLLVDYNGKMLFHPKFGEGKGLDIANTIMVDLDAWQNHQAKKANLAPGESAPELVGDEAGIMTDEHIQHLSRFIENCKIEINILQQIQQRQTDIESKKDDQSESAIETLAKTSRKTQGHSKEKEYGYDVLAYLVNTLVSAKDLINYLKLEVGIMISNARIIRAEEKRNEREEAQEKTQHAKFVKSKDLEYDRKQSDINKDQQKTNT